MTPESQPTPPKLAGLAIQFIINGDGTSIHCSPQSTAACGINVTIGGPGGGPVAVVGTHGSAIGGHAVQADRDATVAPAAGQPSQENWWARLRKRGVVVAIATIVGAIAVVIGTAVAICVWVGLTP